MKFVVLQVVICVGSGELKVSKQMNKKILILSLLLVVVLGVLMGVFVYKWMDEDGVIYFGDCQFFGIQLEKVNVCLGSVLFFFINCLSFIERVEVLEEQEQEVVEQCWEVVVEEVC